MHNQVVHGDCLEVLRTLPDNSVDALCTDPPAGIGFMQSKDRTWDSDKGGRDNWVIWLSSIMSEALRILKPGGHALVWSLPRTSHWTALALEDAGFEIRDCVYHVFGSGFPKSHNISIAIDKHLKAEREVIGIRDTLTGKNKETNTFMGSPRIMSITAPATPEAQQYSGFGSALKPAVECWWLCRKPITEKSIAENVLKWGTGGINIDACRIGTQDKLGRLNKPGYNGWANHSGGANRATYDAVAASGRFPSHLLLSHTLYCTPEQCYDGCPVAEMDRQSGMSVSKRNVVSDNRRYNASNQILGKHLPGERKPENSYNDMGGASRYFAQFYPSELDIPFLYCSKASRKERNAGCEALPEQPAGIGDVRTSGDFTQRLHKERGEDYPPVKHQNTHPTVKPLALMQYLVRLITPPGGLVLDPFGGSGTTALACVTQGFEYLLIEQDADYVEIARARIAYAEKEKRIA